MCCGRKAGGGPKSSRKKRKYKRGLVKQDKLITPPKADGK